MPASRPERSARPFVGRAAELDVLLAAGEAATVGQPTVVWVEGAAGSGKTTLVRRGLAGLPKGFVATTAAGDELATDIGYELARRLGVRGADSGFRVGQELLGLWARGQETGPQAIVVEDIHWADLQSGQALLSAIRRLDQDRVLVVVTSRLPPTGSWRRFIEDDERGRALRIDAFGTEDVAALASLYGTELTTRQAARLTRHTGGHPLWVHTLLQELTAADLQAPGDELPAPRSLAAAVTARLGDVGSPARDLAAALAVINYPVPLSVAGRVAGNAEPVEALEALLTTGFVRWDPRQPGSPAAFTHPLYRQAVYDDLSPTRRRNLHRTAVQVLTPSSVLAHRVAATDGVDDRLAEELEAAARSERAGGATAIAARNLLWASSVSGDTERSARLLVQAGLDLINSNQVARAATLRRQLEATPDTADRNLVFGLLDWELGNPDGAERWLMRAVQGVAGAAETTVARGWAQLAEVFATQAKPQEAIDAADRALSLVHRVADAAPRAWIGSERRAWAVRSLSEGMIHGGPAGVDLLNQRLGSDPDLVPGPDSALLITRAMLNYYSLRPSRVLPDLRAALRLFEQGAVPFELPRCHFLMAAAMTRLGDWDRAIVHARTSLSVAADDQVVWEMGQCHAVLGILLSYRGDWDGATKQVTQATDQATVHRNLEAMVTARVAASALARARADHAGVIEQLGDLASPPLVMPSLQFWPSLVDALIEIGDLDRALATIERLDEVASVRRLDVGWHVVALRARLAAASGQPDTAADLFAHALDHLGPDDPFLDRALVHRDYGRLLRAHGDPQAGIDQLQIARQMLASVGAAPFVARIDDDLAAAGLDSAAALPEWSTYGLTERERDVATLVAQGLSNPEVAAQLYVSRKAVEYHLTNIYGKLGISSRRELQDARLLA